MEATKQSFSLPLLPHFNPGMATRVPRFDHSRTRRKSEKKQRPTWSKQVEFVLSSVGYAVGLGNIWRFPYLCFKNGGGAFLIPYVFFLILCGLPMIFMETSLGQFGSLGSISIWKISPLFKGMGFGMAILSLVVCVYYNVILAWSLYYIYHSYSVSWSTCDNSWNTLKCVTSKVFTQSSNISIANSIENANPLDILNSTQAESLWINSVNSSKMASSEEFWLFYVLRQSSGIEDPGELRWPLVLTLSFVWIIVFFCVARGIKTSGKVVYVTATLPYFVLVSFLIRGLTLPGSLNGILFLLTPKWERLLSFKVWGDAASQIFYSSGVAWGCILTMASHNKFTNNIYRDSMVIACINYGTSLLSGFVVFSLLGFMAYETGKNIEEVVSEGPGLAFVVYPEAISRLPVPSLWAFLFFFMLLAVGLDTAGGIYVVQLMDWYSAAFSLMMFSLFETIIVAWIYGADRFALDIFLMTKRKPSQWWKLCWCYITPAIITLLLLFIFVNHTAITYDDYVYPDWSIVIGWILAMCSIAPVPLYAVWALLKEKGNFQQRLVNCLRPTPDWGLALEEHKILYRKSLNINSSRLEQKHLTQKPVSLDTFSCTVNS